MEKKNIGGLYRKKTKDGKEFLSGWIELGGQRTKIVIWPNKFKKDDKHPDMTIQEDTWTPAKATPSNQEKNMPF